MAEKFSDMRAGIVVALGMVTGALWWFGWLVILYVLCMMGDWITGSAAAMYAGEWSSGKARAGIWHKLGSVIVVMTAAGADMLIGAIINNFPGIELPFAYEVMLCPMVMVWYIAAELGSMVENAVKLDAPVPGFLRRALELLRDTLDEREE